MGEERDPNRNAKAHSDHVQRREKLETQQIGFCVRNSQSRAHVLYVHKLCSGFPRNV